MAVVDVWLTADVAAGGTTHAGHLVAPDILHEAFSAAMALSQHGLCHPLLDERAHVCLTLLLHFFAVQGHMVGFPAKPAKQHAGISHSCYVMCQQSAFQHSQKESQLYHNHFESS